MQSKCFKVEEEKEQLEFDCVIHLTCHNPTREKEDRKEWEEKLGGGAGRGKVESRWECIRALLCLVLWISEGCSTWSHLFTAAFSFVLWWHNLLSSISVACVFYFGCLFIFVSFISERVEDTKCLAGSALHLIGLGSRIVIWSQLKQSLDFGLDPRYPVGNQCPRTCFNTFQSK